MVIIIQVAVTGVAVTVEERESDEGHFLKLKRNLCDRCKYVSL